MKKMLCGVLALLLLLTACAAQDERTVNESASSREASTVVPTNEPQTAEVQLKTADLTEEESRFLALVDDGYTLLYDYTAQDEAVWVELTCYELVGTELKVVNRLGVPAEQSGRIAVCYDRMVEGFRLAVETSDDLHNMKLEKPDRKFPNNCACVGSYSSVDAVCVYGEEIPLCTQIATAKDRASNISAQDLWQNPEPYADAGYEAVYLMTLSIKPKN